MKKIIEIFCLIADVANGMRLLVYHWIAYFYYIYMLRIKYDSILYIKADIKGTVFVSNRPFGSKWLTRRSILWRCQSKTTSRYLAEYNGKIYKVKNNMQIMSLTLKVISLLE